MLIASLVAATTVASKWLVVAKIATAVGTGMIAAGKALEKN